MKITNVTKQIIYQVETTDDSYSDYRTDENGEEWENYLGGIWQPIFGEQRKRLQQMFREYRETDKLSKKWSSLLEAPNNDCRVMLIEPMETANDKASL